MVKSIYLKDNTRDVMVNTADVIINTGCRGEPHAQRDPSNNQAKRYQLIPSWC